MDAGKRHPEGIQYRDRKAGASVWNPGTIHSPGRAGRPAISPEHRGGSRGSDHCSRELEDALKDASPLLARRGGCALKKRVAKPPHRRRRGGGSTSVKKKKTKRLGKSCVITRHLQRRLSGKTSRNPA